MLSSDDLGAFHEAVESQSLRQIRRYLDYGKRVRQAGSLAELHRWLGRILHDEDGVYDTTDVASAFEIGACEWLASHWDELNHPAPSIVTVAGPVDKTHLLRLLVEAPDSEAKSGWALLFAQRYGKIWSWVEERALQTAATQAEPDAELESAPFVRFLELLQQLEPLGVGGSAETTRQLEEAEQLQQRLQREVAATTQRAERAATRAEALQEEIENLRRTVRQDQSSSERLRDERSRRIRIERQARDLAQELERLKSEYVKVDGRLREQARRDGTQPTTLGSLEELRHVAQTTPMQILGLGENATAAELAKARRRFATAFHSDRTSQLPAWVGELFDQLLGVVNAACDRADAPRK